MYCAKCRVGEKHVETLKKAEEERKSRFKNVTHCSRLNEKIYKMYVDVADYFLYDEKYRNKALKK